MSDRKKNVLFLCTGNSCRSQMGEGFARHLLGDTVNAYSAGTAPKGLDSEAIAVMDEAGIDISGGTSKTVEDLSDIEFDLVITVCGHAHETCPTFPGRARVVHQPFDDPPAIAKDAFTPLLARNAYRRVRDEIRKFVANDLPALLADDSAGTD
jgi:arsenate reductase